MNSINVIKPYLWEGIWVFDDPARDLHKEALVSGMPEIIKALCQINNISDESASKGFRLIFSATPFPGAQLHAKHVEQGTGDGELGSDEVTGNWYEVDSLKTQTGEIVPADKGMKGWLCPALFKYFDHTPKALYAKAEGIVG